MSEDSKRSLVTLRRAVGDGAVVVRGIENQAGFL